MSYNFLAYFALFLPIVILIYQVVPQKFRFVVLLIADYAFFILISRFLIVYLLFATVLTFLFGLWIEKISLMEDLSSKEKTKKKRKVLALGIIINILIILVLKYTNFFGGAVVDFIRIFNKNVEFRPIRFLVPIGISFYTLQIISYLTDVYRGTQKAEHKIVKIALYLSFFPQIMEGPIARYHETADALYEGKPIQFNNLKFGYQRIIWGLFKKIVIADRIFPAVKYIYRDYYMLDGSIVFFGAVVYTCQLYMEFSGAMDIIMGSGEIFGINLPENFRQPFFARTAGDFWRRWHITLGTFFKDYIFYPVSLAKPVKKAAKKIKDKCGKTVGKFVAPTVALFCVWVCNGLWHGANWTFLFYGMYYFVIIFIENITENPIKKLNEKLHIKTTNWLYRGLRTVKIFVIIVIGEMFYRADTLKQGFQMFGRIFSDFHITQLFRKFGTLRVDWLDIFIAVLGVIAVTVIGVLCEKNIKVREKIDGWKLPLRWTLWLGLIMFIVIFGAYGSGYAAVDLIYAGY